MHGTAAALLLLALAATATAFAPVGPAAVARRASPRTAVTANYGRRLATTLIKRSSRTSPLSTALASAAGSSEAAPKTFGQKAFETYESTASLVTNLFPVWTVICTCWALKRPADFAWFTTKYFTGALAVLMLSMGITLTPGDFVRVAKRPNSIFMQFAGCYAMMPLLGLGLGHAFNLPRDYLAGMVLVGSINGGQASNLCTYIAKGNVALSVMMTTATTLGAIVMTPLLCKTLLGAVVPLDAAGIAMSTIQVVLGPIFVGMMTNKFAPNFVQKILPLTPIVGITSTCLLVASAVAQVAPDIIAAGWGLQFAVLGIHLLGGLIGYWVPRAAGFGEVASRTMAIETSMKSSAFGFLLAKLHFGTYGVRVPSAVSVVWMTITGSALGVAWRYLPVKAPKFDRSLAEKYPPFGSRWGKKKDE